MSLPPPLDILKTSLHIYKRLGLHKKISHPLLDGFQKGYEENTVVGLAGTCPQTVATQTMMQAR